MIAPAYQPLPSPLAPPFKLPSPGVVEHMGRRCNATWWTRKIVVAADTEESHVCCEPLGHHRALEATAHLCKACKAVLPADTELRGVIE